MVAIVVPVVAETTIVEEEPPERATVDPSGVMATPLYGAPLTMTGVESDKEPIVLSNEKMGEVGSPLSAQAMAVAPEEDCDDAARLWQATERGIEGATTNWLVLESQP